MAVEGVNVKKETGATETEEAPKSSNLCCYSQRVCTLEKLKGFDFCHKHILEDKASPFKPCDFLAKSNGKRCNNPAPKLHDKGKSYCIIHTRKAELRRAVEKRRKRRQKHRRHVKEEGELDDDDQESSTPVKRQRTSSSKSNEGHQSQEEDEEEDGEDDDDNNERNSSDDDATVDSEVGGPLKVDSAWHGDVDSDAESIDSEEEDQLRHAGVWTLDEATRMCCEKMTCLKNLYIGQYKRLAHVLQEKKRKYYQMILVEEEDEIGECNLSPCEILGPFNHEKWHGTEALLHKQAKEKRHGSSSRPTPIQHRCTIVNQGVRCPGKVLPLTKYCIQHISHDPQQLLFQGCSFQTADKETCGNQVPKIYNHSTCRLHMALPDEPTRKDVAKDFQDAQERDRQRLEREQELRDAVLKGELAAATPLIPEIQKGLLSSPVGDKDMLIPKALQEKSSALLPPPLSQQLTIKPEVSDIPSSQIPTEEMKPGNLSKRGTGAKKMDIDPLPSEVLALPILKSAESTPQEVSSPASVDSSPAGIQRISPTLLAASLVAVCSGTGVTALQPSITSTSTSEASKTTDSSAGNVDYLPGPSRPSLDLAKHSTAISAPSILASSAATTKAVTIASTVASKGINLLTMSTNIRTSDKGVRDTERLSVKGSEQLAPSDTIRGSEHVPFPTKTGGTEAVKLPLPVAPTILGPTARSAPNKESITPAADVKEPGKYTQPAPIETSLLINVETDKLKETCKSDAKASEPGDSKTPMENNPLGDKSNEEAKESCESKKKDAKREEGLSTENTTIHVGQQSTDKDGADDELDVKKGNLKDF